MDNMAKKKFEEVVKDTEEAAKKEEKAAEAPKGVDDLRIAYIVGLAEDGNFVFEVRGKHKGLILIELMGIHDYATERIRLLKANALGTEEKVMQEIGSVLLQISQKLDKVLSVTAPSNKL
jgi:hypothetical protein